MQFDESKCIYIKKEPTLSSKTSVLRMQKLIPKRFSRPPLQGKHYACAIPFCPSSARSAEMLLLCTRAMGIEFFFAAFTAPCTILWDTVRVNRIIRSGAVSYTHLTLPTT